MKNGLLLLFILGFTNIYAQKLPLCEVVNAVYARERSVKDTLLYVSSGTFSFIDTSPCQGTSPIVIKTFKNKQELITNLEDDVNRFLLSLLVTDIAPGRMKISMEVSLVNRRMYTGKYPIVVFYDERLIECIYDSAKRVWAYDKTISVKKHITD
ncbi:hypothetical protein [Chitinophaga nivalis]|uniref:Uncharacterized protein n=1 Tax=Chitinophaga nivalis TaxID=2991709 RepID=A0ABT3IJ79_9BACT|nr:hypothetical protein [Chitinophaga nivalis]MCW3466293.1 hypothetical protein [Chitinophaga nivalis]MCW3484016.1 hypothetical protein [Chitinophaga nivalis]